MWTNSDVTSLSDITETDEFTEVMESFKKPPLHPSSVDVYPTRDYQGMEYMLIGMAIDYLIQFEMKRRNPQIDIYSGPLLAEHATEYEDDLHSPISNILSGAKANCKAYANGSDDISLPTQEVLDLARLENLVRSGESVFASVDRYLGESDEDMETDLEELISIAEPVLNIEDYAVVNPTIANESIVADADFIIDDTVIDLKTTINPEFSDSMWKQLVGYLVLLDIQSNLNETTHGWDIEWPDNFGVYYVRSGDLQVLDSSPVYRHSEYPELRASIESEL